ncbi:MAG: hypothetical protein GEU74_10630 [Nitriliruptorales bacterium]|nr:hypothetical protein [Nitriliruptorales bacterium]
MLAALPLALLLALTGCGTSGDGGSGRSGDHVASAGGSTAEGDGNESGEPLSEDETYEKLLEFAQCLRDKGLAVEDPAPGEGIQVQVEGDPTQADAAMQACDHLAPPPPAGSDAGEEREDMLAYAQCMRDNGVEKFADPKPGEGISIGPEVLDDPDFSGAEEACDEILGGDRATNKSDG